MGSNIIELAKLGHERAAELKASCGSVDVRSVAQLISDLATQLEVQYVCAEESQREFRSADITMQNLEAKLKQSKIDADCYKKGMEASNVRLVQLAAENAGLKESHAYTGPSPKYGQSAMMDMKKPFIDKLLHGSEYYSVCGHISAATNRAISAVHGDYSWMPKTPSTDAFLAEVRAQGVEALVLRRKTAARIARERDDLRAADALEGEAYRAQMFADEIRQEAK